VLAVEPNHALAHAMLSICLSHDRDQWHAATREAEQAVHLAPESSLCHYALASVLEKRNRLPEALQAARESLRLDPYQPHVFALAGSIQLRQQDWPGALDSATQGMAMDPDNEQCATIRSLALERLGRKQDAAQEAEAAVARNPDSAEAHAMRGWTQMQNGDYKSAQNSFREALRLDPSYEFARSGMIQALNSNYLLFRLMFRFYSFVGRMAEVFRWALIIGMLVGVRLLNSLADQYPVLQPYVTPITMLYLAFCLLSWIADPLFNTFLRFHSFGKYLLSPKQRWASNLVALCLLAAVLGAVFFALRGDVAGAIAAAVASLFLTLPIASAFEVDEGWPRVVAILCAVVLAGLYAATLGLLVAYGPEGPWFQPYGLFVLGIVIFSFAGNWLKSVTVRR
jgi:Tfp pilus assembly protein PilF